mgnify:CR=1 FL=1|tara:strand:- start:417 stop:878 length:462 start_codon:yes stop_codon:yes gene_type:complete
MSAGFSLEMDEREFKRFKELPFMVAKTAFTHFTQSATVFAHRRARVKKQGKKRTWLTPAQTASSTGRPAKPRGFTSAPGFVPIDTGNLRTSIQWKFNDRGEIVQSFGRIFSGENYAAEMEARRGFFKRAKGETELELRSLFKKAVKRAKAKVQ